MPLSPPPAYTRRPPSRLVLVTPFVLMFGALAACAVAWGVEREQVLHALNAAPAQAAAHGATLTLGERGVSGFPLRLRVRFASARVEGSGGWAAEAQGLVAQAYVFQPRKWVVVAPQGLTVTRPQGGALALSGQALRASVSGLGEAAWRFAAEADDARFVAPPGARAFSLQSARRVEVDAKASATPGETDVLLQVEGGVATPESAVWHVASGSPFDLALTARVAPGAFALERLEAKAGPTAVSSPGGALRTDAEGRLAGSIPLQVRQAAGRPGAVPGTPAAVVIGQARQAGEGSTLNLVFSNGQARLGPFKLGPSPRGGAVTDDPAHAPVPDAAWDADRAQALVAALAALTQDAAAEAARGLDPAGRAMAMRLWLDAARGALPPAALARIVREVEGARLHAAGALRLAVCGTVRTAELARARFGAAPSVSAVSTPERALAAASSSVVAVVAVDATAWWGRLLAQPQLQAIARLPCAGPVAALAVAQVATAPSGGDETFWVTDAPGPAARVEAALGEAGFAADLLAEAGGLKLFALAGYVQADDGRLARAPGRLSGVIGAAPT